MVYLVQKYGTINFDFLWKNLFYGKKSYGTICQKLKNFDLRRKENARLRNTMKRWLVI